MHSNGSRHSAYSLVPHHERKLNPLWIGIGAAVVLVIVLVGVYFLFFAGSPKKAVAQKGKQPAPPPREVTLADLVPGDAWSKDQTVHDLVLRLAGRRTSLADAEKEAAQFIVGTEAEKQQKAKLLFAGLFATLGRERDDVMAGIERFSQRQQQLREKITAELTNLRAQQDAASQEPATADQLSDQITWDTRIFDERRQTISYVCEVPSTIERRLFTLARAIQQKLD